jgi:uncharacterized protein YegP (UPF0339 family)
MEFNQDVVLLVTIMITLSSVGIFVLCLYIMSMISKKPDINKKSSLADELEIQKVIAQAALAQMPDQNPTSMSDYAGPIDGPVIDLTRGGVFTPPDRADGEDQREAEGENLSDTSFVPQPDLTELSKDWEQFDVIDTLGSFEMYSPTAEIFKWRLNEESGVILRSNADYLMESTCRNGILSAIGRINKKSNNPALVVAFTNDFGYRMLLKAVNGKHLGYGEYFDNEDAVKTEIIKAMLVLKDNSSLLPK